MSTDARIDLSRVAYVNEAKRIVYLAHPRTASHATAKALKQAGFTYRSKYHHAPLSGPLPDDWLVLTTVRNHFDALVSWYEDRYSHSRPFDFTFIEFLLAEHPYYFPTRTMLWGLHTPYATHIIHWEQLDVSLNGVLQAHGLGPILITRDNIGKRRQGRDYREYYDPDTREYVEDLFALEMGALGYSYD